MRNGRESYGQSEGLDVGLSYRSRYDLVQDRLRAFITEHELQAGDALPTENELSERLGVSRSVVREALRGLEALGIVEARHGVGRVVCAFSFHPILENLSYGLMFHNRSILQITEIRKALDAHFIPKAIENMTDEDLEILSDIVSRMEERTENGLDMEREDYRFHAFLYRCTDNPLAQELFEITWQARLRALDRTARIPALEEIPPATAPEHRDILEAIREGDCERARECVLAHHWNVQERFRRAIELEA